MVNRVADRWQGDERRQKVRLYGPQYLMAMILDPFFCPTFDGLPDNWETECDSILRHFYPQDGSSERAQELLRAQKELQQCVMRHDAFGEQVKRQQGLLDTASGSRPIGTNMGHLAYEIKHQKVALQSTTPANAWNMTLGARYPKLQDIAIRLMEMGTQSADVEHICKAHKIVHTKVRNRLTNKNVKMLLYCYVNLRLVQRNEEVEQGEPILENVELEDFLNQAILFQLDDDSSDSTN